MTQKRVAFMVLLLAWFAISAYFYAHHRVIVKTMLIPGWELSEQGTLVQVKEVRLYNKAPIQRPFEWYSSGVKNWVVESKLIPNVIKGPLLRLMYFYSYRYESDDAWYMKVNGVYLTKGSQDVAEMPEITLKTGGEVIASYDGRGTMGSEEGNFRFFSVGGKLVGPKLKDLEVVTQWQNKTKVYNLKPNFRTETYSFFSPVPKDYENIDPVEVAYKFFWDYVKQRNVENIKPEFEEKLRWAREHQNVSVFNPYTNYFERYKGYEDVLIVRMNYILSDYTNPSPQKIDRVQDFCLIERNGVLEVVDIGTYIVVD